MPTLCLILMSSKLLAAGRLEAAWSLTASSSWARCDSLHSFSSCACKVWPPDCTTGKQINCYFFIISWSLDFIRGFTSNK